MPRGKAETLSPRGGSSGAGQQTEPGTLPGSLPDWIKAVGPDTWHVYLRVQPGAKKNEIVGEAEGRLRLRITAQAVENKANKALVAFVAERLKLRPNRVRLVSGETGRQKTVEISAPEPGWQGLLPPAP